MNKKGSIIEILIVIFTAFFVVLIFGSIIYYLVYATTSGTETITIKEKWVKYYGDDAKYLVSSTNRQVFQITDTIIKWRFDSSDLYARLDTNMTCDIKTQGWRFPLLSDYKNILEANCS